MTRFIYANWTPFMDASLIVNYEWAVGTLEEPELINPFVSIGIETSAGAGPFSQLAAGTQYFVTVRAEDGQGNTSIARSNGITLTEIPAPGEIDAGTDGGMDGPDGGANGSDGGVSSGDAGANPDGGTEGDESKSPVGYACASTGGASVPVLLGLIFLVLLARRLHRLSR